MADAAKDKFRNNEISFLQEQNHTILASLEKVEHERDEAREQIKACQERDAHIASELQAVTDRIAQLDARLRQDSHETGAKDEHVKVLSEQNNQMIALLEAEETKTKEAAARIRELESHNRRLRVIADEFDSVKAELEQQVASAKSRCADTVANVRGQRNINETLRTNIQNSEARTRVDMESLGQALQVVDSKNLEYMQRINKQETRHQALEAENALVKEEVEKVRASIDRLRAELQGGEEGRSAFERARGPLEAAIEALEIQADTLRKALSTAERANEQVQEENRGTSERCRETADKVYALMDSLRLNQLELKRQEAENMGRDKKLTSLQRQCENLQAKITMESDARVLAEQERREAEQESAVLKKKNRKSEEAVTASQQAQEKAEKEMSVVGDRVQQLQTQNSYLASRIDSQEEEKSAIKVEIKKVADRCSSLSAENTKLRDEIGRLEEEVATIDSDAQAIKKELDYIKREDVLDEAGRQRPVLIQSAESDLLEKLQINEFLYEAQQARNPTPPLIEKIAQLLAMLHEGQSRSDQYLNDLSKSNGLVAALRQRNMALFSRTQEFDSFKTRALMRYIMNLIETGSVSSLHLDGLSFGEREINEMMSLVQRYDAQDTVHYLSLQDNALDSDSVGLLMQLVYTLPYLRALDLRQNHLDPESAKKLEEQLRAMEGVTGVVRTANGIINVHSGSQIRLCVDVSDQVPKDTAAKEIDFSVQQELSYQDADPFIASNAGASQNSWARTAAATQGVQQQPQRGAGGARAVPEPASATDVPQASARLPSQEAPAVGGPPVGLGGPGSVARLNKSQSARKPAKALDPKKRSARRAKGAPPAPLDYHPLAGTCPAPVDKRPPGLVEPPRSLAPARVGQGVPTAHLRPGTGSCLRSESHTDLRDARRTAQALHRRPDPAEGMDRSCSLPSLAGLPRQQAYSWGRA